MSMKYYGPIARQFLATLPILLKGLKPLLPIEFSKLTRKLMFSSSSVTFQLKKILLKIDEEA